MPSTSFTKFAYSSISLSIDVIALLFKYSRHYESTPIGNGGNDKGIISIHVEPANVISLNGFLIF